MNTAPRVCSWSHLAFLIALFTAMAARGQAPQIVSAPADQVVLPGAAVSFSVSATGADPLTYAWFFNSTQQLAQTSTTLILSNASGTNAGFYSVRVANASGAVTSAPARLVVLPLLPGMADTSFDPGTGPNGVVRCVAVDAQGRTYIGGDFLAVSNVMQRYLARLRPDGSVDTSFTPTVSGAVNALVLQTNGQILIGGSFILVNDTPRNAVARLNENGTLDSGFISTLADSTPVWTIALQDDDRILIGGDFQTVDGASRNRIARLNANGSLDATFDPGTGFDDSVRRILVQPDGKVLAGGAFQFAQGAPRGRIARLTGTGSLDAGFDTSVGANDWVMAMELQPDGKVVVGGSFSTVNSVFIRNLARLETDGGVDPTFVVASPDAPVTALAIQPDGKIVIGGGFRRVGSLLRPFFTRLTADGAVDDLFYEGAGADFWVESIALQGDGRILLGGAFQSVSGLIRRRVARVLGGDPTPFAPIITIEPPHVIDAPEGSHVEVKAGALALPTPGFQWQRNGTNLPGANLAQLLLRNVKPADAGEYRLIASNSLGSVTSRVSRLNIIPARTTPGGVDVDFYTGTGPGGSVRSIGLRPDGKVIIGGDFQGVDGVLSPGVARLNSDGSVDAGFVSSINPSGIGIQQVAALPDGSVLFGGGFTFIDGLSRFGIGKVTASGGIDASFNPPFANFSTVTAFFPQTNGQILIAGQLVLPVLGRRTVARLNSDGSLDATFDAGAGASELAVVVEDASGRILVGGEFTTFSGVARNGIVRLNADGSIDSTFNPGSGALGSVESILVLPDGKLLVLGRFRNFNGAPRRHIARLNPDGSLDPTFDPGAGPNGPVLAAWLQPDGRILIVGQFTEVNGVAQGRVARLNRDGSLDLTFVPPFADDAVQAVIGLPGGDFLIGGEFSTVDLIPRPRIARILGGSLPPFPPVISVQPTNQVVQAGEDVTLSVVASGEPQVSYQWQSNGTNIPGATTWTYTLRNVRSSDAAAYAVIVSNPHGSISSATATLTVRAPSREPGAPDINFYAGAGPNARVNAVVVQPDRRILIGGAFTEVDGIARNYIARLNSSGSLDMSFDPGAGANDQVMALALQPDGRIIAAGRFTSVDNVPRQRIVRLETNGAVDLSFDATVGTSANEAVLALALQPDGKLLLGGRFGIVNGAQRLMVARLLPTGAIDSTFAPAFAGGGTIYSLGVQPDGKVLLGGAFFLSVDGVQRPNLARLNTNATLDTNFALAGASGAVFGFGLDDDGRILVGGDFLALGGVSRVRAGRLLANGAVDQTFTNLALNDAVNAVLVQPDGKVVLGGAFTNLGTLTFIDEYGEVFTSGNTARVRLARLETNGVLDLAFNDGSGVEEGATYVDVYGEFIDLTAVTAMAREPDGKLLIAGDFARVNGIARRNIARLFSREASEAIVAHKGVGAVELIWDTGILQVADDVLGPWMDVPNAESPFLYQTGGQQRFFRLKFN